jgi:hypothetical protein
MSPSNAIPGVTSKRAFTRRCCVCGAPFTVVCHPSLAGNYTCCGAECRTTKRRAALAKAREARVGKSITTKPCVVCRQSFTFVGSPSKASTTCRRPACQSARLSALGRQGGLRSVEVRRARKAQEVRG